MEPSTAGGRPTRMVLRALAAVVLAASGLVLLAASPAQACSCAGGPASEAISESTAIFHGTLEDERRGDRGSPDFTSARVLTFAVDRVWKGTVTSSTEIGTGPSGGTCGLEITEGERTLVFAALDERGGLSSNICSSRGATVSDVERLLGPGEPPVAGFTSHPEGGFALGWIQLGGGAVLLLLLAGLTAYVVRRARGREGPA